MEFLLKAWQARPSHAGNCHGGDNAEQKSKVKRIYTWTCQFCGMTFETENYSQRYCNPSHKQRAYELRRDVRLKMPVESEIR